MFLKTTPWNDKHAFSTLKIPRSGRQVFSLHRLQECKIIYILTSFIHNLKCKLTVPSSILNSTLIKNVSCYGCSAFRIVFFYSTELQKQDKQIINYFLGLWDHSVMDSLLQNYIHFLHQQQILDEKRYQTNWIVCTSHNLAHFYNGQAWSWCFSDL